MRQSTWHSGGTRVVGGHHGGLGGGWCVQQLGSSFGSWSGSWSTLTHRAASLHCWVFRQVVNMPVSLRLPAPPLYRWRLQLHHDDFWRVCRLVRLCLLV